MRVEDFKIRSTSDPDLVFVGDQDSLKVARDLIREYADSLEFSLEFQDFEKEIEHLADYYKPPTGFIMLVRSDDRFVGVACLRPLEAGIAEIKRMYIQPAHRGRGLGRRMLRLIIDEAQRMGYRYLRLDTVPDMESANYLYTSTGFYDIEDYTYNPLPGAKFMEYKL